MKIATIVGARPQFIKAAPVSRAIQEHNRKGKGENITEILVHTGQHYDDNMSAVFFRDLNIPKPHVNLGVGSGSHSWQTAHMLMRLEKILLAEKPDLVIVYGDTNSTLAGALSAAKLDIPIAHIEAGLRSYNRGMPEEVNRMLTDHLSTILFCPTKKAVDNLKAEGIINGPLNRSFPAPNFSCQVHIVGDVMLDAALYNKQFAKEIDLEVPEKFILSTIHRQENTDDPERLVSIFKAFDRIGQEIPIVLPIHPRTKRKMQEFGIETSKSRLNLLDPVSYLEMGHLLDRCALVMTDSGGLQKEAFFYRKFCMTLRDETEWVELVECGCNTVTGSNEDEIYRSFERIMKVEINANFNLDLYGDGKASERIVALLKDRQGV